MEKSNTKTESSTDCDPIKIIALHLVSSKTSHEFMWAQPWNVCKIALKEEWLCSLPSRPPGFEDDAAWIRHYRQHSYQPKVIDRAAQLYNDLPRHCKVTSWHATPSPPRQPTSERTSFAIKRSAANFWSFKDSVSGKHTLSEGRERRHFSDQIQRPGTES